MVSTLVPGRRLRTQTSRDAIWKTFLYIALIILTLCIPLSMLLQSDVGRTWSGVPIGPVTPEELERMSIVENILFTILGIVGGSIGTATVLAGDVTRGYRPSRTRSGQGLHGSPMLCSTGVQRLVAMQAACAIPSDLPPITVPPIMREIQALGSARSTRHMAGLLG